MGPARSPWLFSRGVDLAVFGGSALLALALLGVGAATGALEDATPDWAWVPCVLLVDVAHVYSTPFKVYLDGDQEFPTICGTGTEDYFGGAWNFDVPGQGYTPFSTPFLGLPQVLRPDGLYRSQQRFGMYRWHVMDPIRFERDLRVTIQALGWRSEGRFLPGRHDICSVAYWYQASPTAPFPPLPDRNALEIV